VDYLDTVEVIGSIPLAPTIFPFIKLQRIIDIEERPEMALL